jgi:hypothetical protein
MRAFLGALTAGGTMMDTFAQFGYTALNRAGYNGETDCVRVLLNAGADLDIQDQVRRRSPRVSLQFIVVCLCVSGV